MEFIAINGRVVELTGGRIRGAGEDDRLSPRLLSLLAFLVENTDRVLTRDELIEAVWGHLDAATDDSVNVAVSSLRKALGDDRRPHRILRAIPRRGYWFESKRFERLDEVEAERRLAGTSDSGGRTGSRSPLRRWAPLLAGVTLAVAIGGLWLGGDRGGEPGARSLQATEGAAPAKRAVAVLPFTDMSAQRDQGHFADGLVDRIIHMLTLSPELEVVARTSSFAFRDGNAGIGEIAERLRVDAVLEGSVQRADGTIRVLAQLIDADSEKHLWSRTYDRPVGQIFELQDEIANQVSRTMTDTLLPGGGLPPTESERVWELVARGRMELEPFTLESAVAAIDYFEQALALQPDNVEALIGMIEAITKRRSHGSMRRGNPEDDETLPYLRRAQELAPDSSIVLRATGDWHFNHGRPDEALADYRKAISANPNDAAAYRHMGRTLFRQARYEEALEPLRTSVRLDPFSTVGNVWLADTLWAQGRAEEALFQLRRIIADQPNEPQAHDRFATYLAQTGETATAMRHILRARELDPGSGRRGFRVCEFWLQLGDADRAQRCTDQLLTDHELPFYGGYLRQALHGFRREWDAQRAELEALYAMNQRDPLTRSLLAQSYSRDDCPRALEILEESFPELFAEPPEVNPMLLLAAKTGVYCLQQTGQSRRAEALVRPFAAQVERIRSERGPWLVSGIEPAWVHALEGEYDAAIKVLEELVDDDWRYYWWGLDAYPSFAPIVDDPRFIELNERLRAGVREQLEWFDANRDAPLI